MKKDSCRHSTTRCTAIDNPLLVDMTDTNPFRDYKSLGALFARHNSYRRAGAKAVHDPAHVVVRQNPIASINHKLQREDDPRWQDQPYPHPCGASRPHPGQSRQFRCVVTMIIEV